MHFSVPDSVSGQTDIRQSSSTSAPVNTAGRVLLMRYVVLTIVMLTTSAANAQKPGVLHEGYVTLSNVRYYAGEDLTPYQQERCRLDLYYPADKTNYATVVWFHGGGLKNGNRSIPKELRRQGIAVVAVNYRLYPRAKGPAYLQDAAAAIAWTLNNIAAYGGSEERVFVSGHSAGGYLTSMTGLDRRWLAAHGIDPNQLAGLIPFSGQTVTHSTVREERGIPDTRPVVDDMAPLYHIRKDAPPLLLITGDRDLELRGRYEENAYLWRMMQTIGHSDTELYELEGFNHGQMARPAHELLLRFIREHSK